MKEKQPLDIVKDTEKELKKYDEQFHKGIIEQEEIYYGDIWPQGKYRPFENDIFKIVETMVPILTDSVSGVVASVVDPEYQEQSKILSQAIKYELNREAWTIKQPQVIRNSLVTRGFVYVDYCHYANKGEGGNKLEVLHWKQVKLDGNVSFIEEAEKAQIILHKRKNWLKRKYPKHAEEIDKMKAKESSSDDSQRGRETQDSGGGFKKRKPERATAEDILDLKITYIKDDSLEQIPEEVTAQELKECDESIELGEGSEVNLYQDHKTHIAYLEQKAATIKMELGVQPEASFEEVESFIESVAEENDLAELTEPLFKLKIIENQIEEHKILLKENPKGGRPKYRGGFRVIESVESKVLYDGESRFNHGEIPIVPFYAYKDGTIYGIAEVRNLIDSQRMSAVMQYKEYKGLQKVANPALVIDRESGLTKDDVTNEDGAIYEIEQGTNPPQYLNVGQVSEQVARFTEKKTMKMGDISGVNEATEGKMPAPNASGVTIEKIQTRAIGRVRLKDRQNEYYSMRRLGLLIASNIMQFWTTERVLKLDDQSGNMQQVVFNPLEMQDLNYDVEISAGSMAGVDKDAFNGLLSQLLNAGHIDLPMFLEVADIPKTQKLKEMLGERDEQAQMLQRLQMENLQMKAQFAFDTLTEEELQMLSEMQESQ